MIKKTILSVSLMALASMSHAVTDLGLDEECNFNGTWDQVSEGPVLCELPLSIVEDDTVVLAKEVEDGDYEGEQIIWTLPGIVVVGNGNTQNANPNTVDNTVLKIEAGAQIAGALNSYSALIISRGAQIDAQGTASEPIVFSSLDAGYDGSNEWGGLVLAGFGESNACPSGAIAGGQMGDACTMEGFIDNYYYGSGHLSAPNAMSSGILDYVVIAEGGHVILRGYDINGLNLYAVNSTTTINNVHVHGNEADGVQFFGGNVGISNMWLSCNEDDSIDWGEGYQGFLSNVNIKQNDGAGYGLELANNPYRFHDSTYFPTPPYNENALPRSKGTVLNISIDFVGTGAPATSGLPFDLKQGTDGVFTNVVIGAGYDSSVRCMRTDTAVTGGSHWSVIEYGCDATHAGPTAWSLPASNPSATGFTASTFWAAAPSCP